MARRKSYQRGTVEKHNGHWTVRYYVLDGLGNKTKRREKLSISSTSSKRTALNAAEPIMVRVNEQNNNPRKAKEQITFKAFVEGRWASYQVKEKLKDSTVYSYESMTKKHLMPTFGDQLLDEITPGMITSFFDKLVEQKAATKYVLNIYALLNIMFEVALQYDLIEAKPIRSKVHKPNHEAKEKPTLTLDQIRSILLHVDESKRFLFFVLFVTGVRIGECCAFRWADLDFARGELSITHSIWRGRLTSPKTKASERLLRLPENLVQMFFDHRQQSAFKADSDFIFCRPDGRALDPDILREWVLYPAMDKAEIQRQSYSHGFHVFRHTAGSILYDETGRMKLVQKTLGHSREQTTSDIYVHVTPEAVADSVEILYRELLADSSLFQPGSVELVN